MKSNNENEASVVMVVLCACGFFIAFALAVAGLAYNLESILIALGGDK